MGFLYVCLILLLFGGSVLFGFGVVGGGGVSMLDTWIELNDSDRSFI